MDWLTKKLKKRVKEVFENKYGRELKDDEVFEIANSLVGFLEIFSQFKWRNEYEKQLAK